MRQSPPANFLQVRRGAPSPQHRLKRANQTPIPAESARPLSGLEVVAALWLAAAVWAFIASLALALRRGFRDGDWSAFRRGGMTDDAELVDWSTQTGQYAWMAVAEEHERLMRGD